MWFFFSLKAPGVASIKCPNGTDPGSDLALCLEWRWLCVRKSADPRSARRCFVKGPALRFQCMKRDRKCGCGISDRGSSYYRLFQSNCMLLFFSATLRLLGFHGVETGYRFLRFLPLRRFHLETNIERHATDRRFLFPFYVTCIPKHDHTHGSN